MQHKFNVGDRVRVTYFGQDLGGATVTRIIPDTYRTDYRAMLDTKPAKYIQEMYLYADQMSHMPKKTLADALSLEPLPRKILGHLERRKSISPMEALTVYGTSRLAAAVHKLRQAGYDIVTNLQEDDVGHRYARYSLAA